MPNDFDPNQDSLKPPPSTLHTTSHSGALSPAEAQERARQLFAQAQPVKFLPVAPALQPRPPALPERPRSVEPQPSEEFRQRFMSSDPPARVSRPEPVDEPHPSRETPRPEASAKKPSGAPLPILFLVLLLIVGGAAGFFIWQQYRSQNQPLVIPNPTPTSTVSEVMTPPLTSTPSATATPSATPAATTKPSVASGPQKTYDSPQGLTFSYPSSWEVEAQTLEKGQSLREPNRDSVVATTSPVEVVDVTKDNWTVRIVISYLYSRLGGYGTVTDFADFKEVPVLGRTALRTKLEEGKLPFRDHNDVEPYSMPIIFRRFPGEKDSSWPQPDREGAYVGLFSTNDPDNEVLNLSVTVYSPDLTKNKIEAKEITASDMAEIDQILSSIKMK